MEICETDQGEAQANTLTYTEDTAQLCTTTISHGAIYMAHREHSGKC